MTTLRLANHAIAHAKEAKEELLRREGIGTDLPPSICAWAGNRPIGYAMLTNPTTDELATLINAIDTITTGWHADTIALVKEGYSTLDDTPDPRPLHQRFPTDHTVHECLTVTTVTHHTTLYAVLPYTIRLRHTIDWHPHDTYPTTPGHDPYTSRIHAAITRRRHHPAERAATPHHTTERLSRLGFTSIWLPPELRPTDH
jgi:hypothetical protein